MRNTTPYALSMQEHNEQAGSASGTQRSKVTKVEHSIIEKEAMAVKYKDFVIALYLTGMHGNKAEELACLLRNPSSLDVTSSMPNDCNKTESCLAFCCHETQPHFHPF